MEISGIIGMGLAFGHSSTIQEMAEKNRKFVELVEQANLIYGKDMREVVRKRFQQTPISFYGMVNQVRYEIQNELIHKRVMNLD